jgi:hypothetical protein
MMLWNRQKEIELSLARESMAGMNSRIGAISLGILLCSFVPAFLIGSHQAQYCFAPNGHNWVWWLEQFFIAATFLSVLGAIAGLIWDKRRSIALIALVLWFPLALIISFAGACP